MTFVTLKEENRALGEAKETDEEYFHFCRNILFFSLETMFSFVSNHSSNITDRPMLRKQM